MQEYQTIIIGTGQAGPALARRLAAAGWQIAVIERKLFGGTCHNTGCTPTKTLIASAYAAHVARRAADYGVNIGGRVTVDMKAVKARKDAVVGPTPNGIERSLKALRGCTVYEGHARFVGPNEVKVGDAVLKSDKIFIDVGGCALVPPIPGLDQIPYLTNSSNTERSRQKASMNRPCEPLQSVAGTATWYGQRRSIAAAVSSPFLCPMDLPPLTLCSHFVLMERRTSPDLNASECAKNRPRPQRCLKRRSTKPLRPAEAMYARPCALR